ncbi:MAG: CoA transferase [Bacteroidetes bacterium]|nr:CoA transferase [Bacteroidota bacterium]
MMNLPLKGLVVLEFSQYLAGPSAGLRFADLGARVIKIERPGTGDAGRKLAIKNLWVDDNSLLFHTINRNKESYTADLKNEADFNAVKKIIAKADVLIHNFRPGVMEKTGLGFEAVKLINPKIIYAVISGYGKEGPWKDKPGQDLLLQSITGLAYTTGNGPNGPVPFGISIADILCGAQLVQGILAALIRRQKKNTGALIEVSLMESLLDFQFELLTTYYTNHQQPQRSKVSNGQPLLSAPYGIYETTDGFIAIAMMEIAVLGKAIGCKALLAFEQEEAFSKRDMIKQVLADFLVTQNTQHWLSLLHNEGLWAMPVLDWEQMMQQEAYKVLSMEQKIVAATKEIITTRCPIRINGKILYTGNAAPQLGEHNEKITNDFAAAE